MNKRIKILYTIPNFNTAGSGKSVYDLVKGLDRTIFEPEICCFHDKGPFFKVVEELGIPIHLFPFTAAYRPRLTFLFRVLKIRNFFKAHQFDVIHSWHWSSDISEPLAAKLAGIPYVYTKKAMGWNNRYWSWRSKLSTKVVVVNEDMVNMYFSKMLHKIEKFPLAIDTNYYQPSQKIPNIKEDLGLKNADFVVLTIANMVAVKGIEILIEAIKKSGDDSIKLVIVGNDKNDYGTELKNKYKQNKNVLFLGKQLDVIPYLAMADLFVIPTKDEGRREGIPNAPLEAMAMETVVLGSDISGVRDILKHFPECLFQASNIDMLKKKIIEIKNMADNERQTLAISMRNQVIEEFSIEEFLKNHEQLYLNMVK